MMNSHFLSNTYFLSNTWVGKPMHRYALRKSPEVFTIFLNVPIPLIAYVPIELKNNLSLS